MICVYCVMCIKNQKKKKYSARIKTLCVTQMHIPIWKTNKFKLIKNLNHRTSLCALATRKSTLLGYIIMCVFSYILYKKGYLFNYKINPMNMHQLNLYKMNYTLMCAICAGCCNVHLSIVGVCVLRSQRKNKYAGKRFVIQLLLTISGDV